MSVSLAQSSNLLAAVSIDDFTTYQIVTAFGPPAGPKSAFGSIAASEALGAERDIQVDRTSNNSGTVSVEVAGSGMGISSYSSGLRTTGKGLIVWDGVDNSQAINPLGLGGFDLTQAGVNSTFQISRASDLGGQLKVTIYEDATHISEALLNVAADPSFTFTMANIPFSTFVNVGLNGGANFANVGAISLLLDGSTAGADIGVEYFVAVPEAQTLLPAAGLMCSLLLNHLRRFEKRQCRG